MWTQETLQRLATRWSQVTSPKAFCRRVMHNIVIDHAGVPSELPVAMHDSPTEAEFDAMPTDPSALRAVLLSQARQQEAQAIAEQQRMMAAHGKKRAVPQPLHLTDDDNVLYKVLAATPGVQVTRTTDMVGRPAMKISRFDSAADVIDETFQNPATGGVLETTFVYPASRDQGTDLYLSITSSNTLPPAHTADNPR